VLIPAIGALKGNLMPMTANTGLDMAGEAAGATPPGRWSGGETPAPQIALRRPIDDPTGDQAA